MKHRDTDFVIEFSSLSADPQDRNGFRGAFGAILAEGPCTFPPRRM